MFHEKLFIGEYDHPRISAEKLAEITKQSYTKREKPAFRIASNKQRWHDFTLNRGHVYGTFKGGYYVSTGEIVWKETKSGKSIAYLEVLYERGNKNMYRWFKTYIDVNAPLCRAILACIHEAPAWYRGMEYYCSTRDCKNMMNKTVRGHELTTVVG